LKPPHAGAAQGRRALELDGGLVETPDLIVVVKLAGEFIAI
jgi:hypothetical protein